MAASGESARLLLREIQEGSRDRRGSQTSAAPPRTRFPVKRLKSRGRFALRQRHTSVYVKEMCRTQSVLACCGASCYGAAAGGFLLYHRLLQEALVLCIRVNTLLYKQEGILVPVDWLSGSAASPRPSLILFLWFPKLL